MGEGGEAGVNLRPYCGPGGGGGGATAVFVPNGALIAVAGGGGGASSRWQSPPSTSGGNAGAPEVGGGVGAPGNAIYGVGPATGGTLSYGGIAGLQASSCKGASGYAVCNPSFVPGKNGTLSASSSSGGAGGAGGWAGGVAVQGGAGWGAGGNSSLSDTMSWLGTSAISGGGGGGGFAGGGGGAVYDGYHVGSGGGGSSYVNAAVATQVSPTRFVGGAIGMSGADGAVVVVSIV